MSGKQDMMNIWETAIALQQLEQWTPSYFFKEAARQCAEAGYGIETLSRLVEEFYERYPERSGLHMHEADRNTIRAAQLLMEDTFSLSAAQYRSIDRRLFKGAEKIKKEKETSLERSMPVVFCGEAEREEALAELFARERWFDYTVTDPPVKQAVTEGKEADVQEVTEAAETKAAAASDAAETTEMKAPEDAAGSAETTQTPEGAETPEAADDPGQAVHSEEENRRLNRIALHLSRFTADLWQIHPFEGSNTQATAVFLLRYLKSLGFQIDYTFFADHIEFFKASLIRACYINLPKRIYKAPCFLQLFLQCLLRGEKDPMLDDIDIENTDPETVKAYLRRTIVNGEIYDYETMDENADDAAGKSDGEGAEEKDKIIRRAKSYRREEAVLTLIKEDPNLTLQEIARRLNCSESTVKRALQRLTSAGVVQRSGARKNGQWEIVKG